MSIPQLRTSINMSSFAKQVQFMSRQFGVLFSELGTYFHDLDRWRAKSSRAQKFDFTLLDMRNGAGWQLAKKLVCRRNDFLRQRNSYFSNFTLVYFHRGRLSAQDALKQRYFN